jgi:hypothetical protein
VHNCRLSAGWVSLLALGCQAGSGHTPGTRGAGALNTHPRAKRLVRFGSDDPAAIPQGHRHVVALGHT